MENEADMETNPIKRMFNKMQAKKFGIETTSGNGLILVSTDTPFLQRNASPANVHQQNHDTTESTNTDGGTSRE